MKSFSFIFHNLGMKTIALVVAFGLWVFVAASMNNVAKFPGSIPIKVVNANPNLVAIYDVKEVNIKISAESAVWQQLSSDNFSGFIDLNGLSAGTHNVKVTVTSGLSNIKVVEIDPANIMVRLEPLVKKEVPVAAVLLGQAAEGRSVGGVDFTPDKAEISGAKSIIDSVGAASAEIQLAGEADSFSRSVSLKVLNDKGEQIPGVSVNPAESQADVKIIKAGNNKTVGVKVLTSGFPQTGYFISSLTADPAVVNIIGQDSILRTIQYIETQAVDITNLKDPLTKAVALNLPPGISLQRDQVARVNITVTFAAASVSKEIQAGITPLNLTPGLKVLSYTPASIKVIVSGPVDVINNLGSADVVLNLDLAGRSTGTAGVDLTREMFKLPAGISLISFLPSSISVVLSIN